MSERICKLVESNNFSIKEVEEGLLAYRRPVEPTDSEQGTISNRLKEAAANPVPATLLHFMGCSYEVGKRIANFRF